MGHLLIVSFFLDIFTIKIRLETISHNANVFCLILMNGRDKGVFSELNLKHSFGSS